MPYLSCQLSIRSNKDVFGPGHFKRFYWIITTNLSSSSMRVELRTKDSDTSGWQPHLSSSSSSQSRSLMINGKNIIMISILITFTDVQAAEQTPVSENAVWPGGTFDNDGGGDYDNWWLLWLSIWWVGHRHVIVVCEAELQDAGVKLPQLLGHHKPGGSWHLCSK